MTTLGNGNDLAGRVGELEERNAELTAELERLRRELGEALGMLDALVDSIADRFGADRVPVDRGE